MVGKRAKQSASDESESSSGDVSLAIANVSPWSTPPREGPSNQLSPSPPLASDHDERLNKRDLAALTIASCVGICIKSLHHHQLRNSAETIAAGTESNITWGLVLSLVLYTLFACWLDTSTIHRTDPIAVTGWILILVVVVVPPNSSTMLVFDTTYMVYSLVVSSPVLADPHVSFNDRLKYMASGQVVNLCATLSVNFLLPLWVPPKLLLIVAGFVLLRGQAMMASSSRQPGEAWLVLIPYHRRRRRRRGQYLSVTNSKHFLSLAVERPLGSTVWIWWCIELLLEAQLHVYRPSIPSSLPRLQASTLLVFLLFYGCKSYRPVYAAMFGLGAIAAITTNQQHHQWMGWPLCAVQWAGYQFVLADVLRSNNNSHNHNAASLVGRTKLVCRLAAAVLRHGGVLHANLALGGAFALQLVLWRQYTVSLAPPPRRTLQNRLESAKDATSSTVETSIILA